MDTDIKPVELVGDLPNKYMYVSAVTNEFSWGVSSP